MASCCILSSFLILTAIINTLFFVSNLPLLPLSSTASSNLIGDILKQSSSLIHSDSSLSVIVIDMIDLGSETVNVFKSSSLPKTINEPLKPVFTYQMKGLPIQNYSNYAINYLGGNEPLYLLQGSVLNYSFEIINDNSTNCPVRLDFFDNIYEYQHFLQYDYLVPLMSSSCITESTYHPVSFIINKSSSYFVAIQIAANVTVNSTISVDYVYYNRTGLSRPDDCNDTLTSVNPKCKVTVCNSYLSCTSDYYILVEPSGVVNMSVTRIQRFLLNGETRKILYIIRAILYIILCIICIANFLVSFIKLWFNNGKCKKEQLCCRNFKSQAHSLIISKIIVRYPLHYLNFFYIGIFMLWVGFFLGFSLSLLSTNSLNLMLPLTVPVSNDVSNHPTLVGSLRDLNPASSFNIELVQHNTTNTTTLVNVHYKSSCSSDELMTEENNLPKKLFSPLQISQFIRAGLNYHGNNTPINLATGSYLMYNINVSYINQGCLRLYLIHTADAYFTFIHSTVNTTFNKFIERTDCLKLENIVYKFSITTLQGDFYVAYEAQNVHFSAKVSGKEVHFNVSNLQTPCPTPLSIENPTCVVKTCSNFLCFDPHPMQCIFISSTSDEINVMTPEEVLISSEQPLFSGAAAIHLLIVIIGILWEIVIIVVIVIIRHATRKS